MEGWMDNDGHNYDASSHSRVVGKEKGMLLLLATSNSPE
jgi:hypothetical protein